MQLFFHYERHADTSLTMVTVANLGNSVYAIECQYFRRHGETPYSIVLVYFALPNKFFLVTCTCPLKVFDPLFILNKSINLCPCDWPYI